MSTKVWELDEADTSLEAEGSPFASSHWAQERLGGRQERTGAGMVGGPMESMHAWVLLFVADVSGASDERAFTVRQLVEQRLGLVATERRSAESSELFPPISATGVAGEDVQFVSVKATDGTSGEFAAQPQEGRPDFDVMARALFEGAAYEEFEDGMESQFSVQLETFVAEHGRVAVEAVKPLIEQRLPNDAVVSEALTCLSRLRDSRTHAWRRHVLRDALDSPSVFVRDAAAVGLARLGDASAVDPLREALEREVSPLLKEYMAHVVKQLTEEQE